MHVSGCMRPYWVSQCFDVNDNATIHDSPFSISRKEHQSISSHLLGTLNVCRSPGSSLIVIKLFRSRGEPVDREQHHLMAKNINTLVFK